MNKVKRNDKDVKYRAIISNKIDTYLRENNICNEDFGKIFGVSEYIVRCWRKNDTSLNPDELIKLCKYWNITLEQLFDPDYTSLSSSDLSPSELETIELSRKNKEFSEVIASLKNMLKK